MEKTNIVLAENSEHKICTTNVKHKQIEDTTYEVVLNYMGKKSLLDLIKNSIQRDIENGNY